MINYYIESENKILAKEQSKESLKNIITYFLPQYANLEIKETKRPIELSKDGTYYVFADTEEYKEQKAQEEAERTAMLKLTRGDVFRALLLAKGVTREQIKMQLEAMPMSTTEEKISRELALIDFDEALDFYRGNPLIDTVGIGLGITKQQLDEFFETNDYTKLI